MEIRPILSALLRSKTGAVLVAAQVALTLAIVANAAFIVRTKISTSDRVSGVDEPNLFELSYVASKKIDDRKGAMQKDLEILRAMPGVVGAATVNMVPLGQSGWDSGLCADKTKVETCFDSAMYMGDEALVPTLGVRIIEGHNFTPDEVEEIDDRTGQPKAHAIILGKHLAQEMFPGETSFVGKLIYDDYSPTAEEMRIVGIMDQLISPWAPASADAYDSVILPVRLIRNRMDYVVRTAPGQRDRVMTAAETALTGLRTDRVRTIKRTFDSIRESRYRDDKTGAGMLIAVAIGLLLVTGSGIVGVASLWVSQRRRQIGVRRALGAGRIDILRYFVTENLLITTAGVVVGVALAIGLNLFLAHKLAMPRLPVAYMIGGVIGLWTLGIVAVLGPAWRAAVVPPAVATRAA